MKKLLEEFVGDSGPAGIFTLLYVTATFIVMSIILRH